jgi:hypothetical protein
MKGNTNADWATAISPCAPIYVLRIIIKINFTNNKIEIEIISIL